MHLQRTSLIALVLAAWLGGQEAFGDGWSLNPFSSSKSAQKTSKEPSALQKMNKGTKDFFGKVGKAVTPSKPTPKKKKKYDGYNPYVKHTKEKPSFFSSLFAPKESEPPHSLQEWMALEPIRP